MYDCQPRISASLLVHFPTSGTDLVVSLATSQTLQTRHQHTLPKFLEHASGPCLVESYLQFSVQTVLAHLSQPALTLFTKYLPDMQQLHRF